MYIKSFNEALFFFLGKAFNEALSMTEKSIPKIHNYPRIKPKSKLILTFHSSSADSFCTYQLVSKTGRLYIKSSHRLFKSEKKMIEY